MRSSSRADFLVGGVNQIAQRITVDDGVRQGDGALMVTQFSLACILL